MSDNEPTNLPLEADVAETETAWELTEADFIDQAAPAAARPPGPGLLEAVGWTLGVVIVHAVAAAAIVLVIALANGRSLESGTLDVYGLLDRDGMVTIIAGEQFVFVLFAVLAVILRLNAWRSSPSRLSGANDQRRPLAAVRRRLSLSSIPIVHVVLIFCLVLPVNLVASKGSQLFADLWNNLAEHIPGLEPVEHARLMQILLESLAGNSLATLVLVLAALPAIGEELIFRGLIGRGLVARWGLRSGVLLTSVLFAAVHLDPVHAVGVLPLGIVMHLVYLATRSFWAAVLFHFLNNSLAAVGLWFATRMRDDLEIKAAITGAPQAPALLYVAAAFCVVALLAVLWKTRVEYVLPDGRLWDPGYPSVEAPPAQLSAVRVCREAGYRYYALLACGIASLGGAMVYVGWLASER